MSNQTQKLYRSQTNKVFAGVCGGLGEYFDVDPVVMRKLTVTRMQRFKFYNEAQMAMRLQWCVAAVPSAAWAQKIFPELAAEAAVDRLWHEIFKLARIDQVDPVNAWQEHVRNPQSALSLEEFKRRLNEKV